MLIEPMSVIGGMYSSGLNFNKVALAGVSYTFGRESVAEYNESLAGVRLIDDTLKGRTVDEQGALLPYFNCYDTLIPGSGDERVMNYNFRPTMTKDSANFVADYLQSSPALKPGDLIGIFPRGSGKYEFNNQQRSLISLGMFGANAGYTNGDQKTWTLI